MRVARLILSVSISSLLSIIVAAQQTGTSSTQALLLLQRSLSALAGGQAISDVTLSGTAHRIAGSDDDTGTAVLKALASGASRMDLTLSSGQRSEIRTLSASTPAGAWSGPDGISHEMVFHNLLAGSSWFFPTFPVAKGLSPTGYAAAYVGREAHNGLAVEHLSVSQIFPVSANSGGTSFQHLSQVDFFLDSTSLLPSSISFNIHPDDNALLDIPIEVRFSDYRYVNGAQIPFHIQKYLNNSLTLDFQAQSVTLNSGLTATAFSAQ